MKKISRKQFLKYSGGALAGSVLSSPFAVLLESIMGSSIRSAFASEGARPRKWLDMRFDGAPPRFVYDLFLHNLSGDRATTKFIPNPFHTFTKFEEVGGRYVSGKYVTVEMKALSKSTREVWAPYLWSQNVPAAGGGTRPMSDLLKNFLNVRGIDTGNPSHDGSSVLHYVPLGASQSIPAMSADGSTAPIAAVVYGANYYKFRSVQSNSAFVLSGSDLAASLLAPFDPNFGNSLTVARARQELVKDYLEAARAGLKADSVGRHPDSASIQKSISGARELMGSSVSTLKNQWGPLYEKYSELMSRSLLSTIPGINDKPIGIAASQRKPASMVASNPGAGAYDLQGATILNGDLRSLITENTYLIRMAQSFAISEFIVVNNLSDSITVNIGAFANLAAITTANGSPVNTSSNFDEHTTGGMLSTYLNTMLAVAHAACLLELIDKLKASGQWGNVVINCSGEFNRIPRGNGTGSDHLYNGASLALYSGIIDGPHILGDIASNSHPQNYYGTSGVSVPQAGLATDNTKIDIGNAAATIAQLLGVKSPITAREPLVLVRGNSVFPRIPPGKIVTTLT